MIDSASKAGLKPEAVQGIIELEHVDFIYPARPSVQVLYDFCAVFPRGKMTAVSFKSLTKNAQRETDGGFTCSLLEPLDRASRPS